MQTPREARKARDVDLVVSVGSIARRGAADLDLECPVGRLGEGGEVLDAR